jgi:hypothetical protein
MQGGSESLYEAPDEGLSPAWKVYYWSNVIGLPLIFLLSGVQGEFWLALFVGFVTVSGLLDTRIRGAVVRFWAWLSGFVVAGGCILGIIATMTALIAIIFIVALVAIAAVLAILVAAVYLWINSIVVLVRDYQRVAALGS